MWADITTTYMICLGCPQSPEIAMFFVDLMYYIHEYVCCLSIAAGSTQVYITNCRALSQGLEIGKLHTCFSCYVPRHISGNHVQRHGPLIRWNVQIHQFTRKPDDIQPFVMVCLRTRAWITFSGAPHLQAEDVTFLFHNAALLETGEREKIFCADVPGPFERAQRWPRSSAVCSLGLKDGPEMFQKGSWWSAVLCVVPTCWVSGVSAPSWASFCRVFDPAALLLVRFREVDLPDPLFVLLFNLRRYEEYERANQLFSDPSAPPERTSLGPTSANRVIVKATWEGWSQVKLGCSLLVLEPFFRVSMNIRILKSQGPLLRIDAFSLKTAHIRLVGSSFVEHGQHIDRSWGSSNGREAEHIEISEELELPSDCDMFKFSH